MGIEKDSYILFSHSITDGDTALWKGQAVEVVRFHLTFDQ